MKIQTVLHASISILIGTFTSAITIGLWSYFLSFYDEQVSGGFIPVSLSKAPKLSFLLGVIFGAIFGFLIATIIVLTKRNLLISALTGAAMGIIFFFLLSNKGNSKSEAIVIQSLIPIGAIIGIITFYIHAWLNNSNSLK